MARCFSGIVPISSTKSEDGDGDGDFRADYSFAIEYRGPPISHDIPQAIPIDIFRIPTASVAATMAVMSKSLSLPVSQPIVKNRDSYRKPSEERISSLEVTEPQDLVRHSEKLGISGRVSSRKLENGSLEGGSSAAVPNDQSSSSSGTLRYFDCLDDSNGLSESTDGEDLGGECKASVSCNCESTMPLSKESASSSRKLSSYHGRKSEDSVTETCVQRNRTSTVTSLDVPSRYATSEETDGDEPSFLPETPVVSNYGKRGLCHRCQRRGRFAEREVCIVCSAQYCAKCVIRAMGSMPEGRKCIKCIGHRIEESKRDSLGKCSRMLKRLLADEHLCKEKLTMLLSCRNPPKKLRPGRYWYDKDSGFWGKEGKKPCQIISAEMDIGSPLMPDASNGDTKVLINGREITRPECWMLRAAGIHCEGGPSFWLTSDGNYTHEGMDNVGNLWKKKKVRIACAALSLPFPSGRSNPSGEDSEEGIVNTIGKNIDQRILSKLLLVGFDQSGTGTIFKQAKMIHSVPFSEDELQNLKHVIQRNLYKYICILLEGRTHFEEEHLIEMRRKLAQEPGPSGIFEQVERSNMYSLNSNLKAFSNWVQEIMRSGMLDVMFPAATREYAPLVEQLWKDKAFQATYKRRNELHALPAVANYFLDRAVEISRADYEPTQMDILYADGINSSNGIASMEFSFPNSSPEGFMDSLNPKDSQMRCQLTRVDARSLGEHCKWLDMFEDVDIVLYCVALTDYDEYYEDRSGVYRNKMLAIKKHFETIVTHPSLSGKSFLLILNKFDLLEDKIDRIPLSQCDWFQDFNPVISHPHTNSNSPPLAQRAFHYVAVKFKRLFRLLTDRKLFVTRATANEADSIDKALNYSRDILKWRNELLKMQNERHTASTNECTTASTEISTSV
ncbi:extra-large guanine nucleotide-binding protein 1-like isoform X2 [Andrographis paniculata]|uniref:extra-large guanine nucleotide-binding protein 1-like isoform X2 n=1 Tax=Andrographis paniculata TaxID=175694 RepID=UPI0021E94F58|nr:extra-large guanine nucleotide-binding protein 1-like isoform X2 [Andrographis paniculata]